MPGVKGQKWGFRQYQYPDGTWTELGKERRRIGGERTKHADIPNAKHLKDYDGPAYFISEKKFDGDILEPRVPKNYFTKNGYEDSTTSRVSFAPSIQQCLAGLSQNVEGKTYYVYSPADISKCDVYKPNNKAVPDSTVTDELWITNPCEIKLKKKITVTGNEGKPGIKFSYGDKTAELYNDWIFEEVKNYDDISHSFGFRTSDSLMHHGIKGQEWGVRNGPPYPLQRPSTDISDENYAKIEELYQSMSLQDRSWIDPDNPEKPYFSSKKNYYESVAFNAVSKHGFIVAEKIPEDQNVDQTHGVEVGIGVTKKGKGIGSGLTKDLTDWFDSQDDYDVIWWPVDERNGASIRIAEKNGFIKDPLGDNYIYAKDSAYKKLGIESG